MLEVAADGICFDPTAEVERHWEVAVDTIDDLRAELRARNLLAEPPA